MTLDVEKEIKENKDDGAGGNSKSPPHLDFLRNKIRIIWMTLDIEKEIEENKDDGTGGHQHFANQNPLGRPVHSNPCCCHFVLTWTERVFLF